MLSRPVVFLACRNVKPLSPQRDPSYITDRENCLHIRAMAANIFNKHSWTANKGFIPST